MRKLLLKIIKMRGINALIHRFLRTKFVRKRRLKQYFSNNQEYKLQIGFGYNPIDGWLNTGIAFWECWNGMYMDAGKPFPLPDNSFDYVFSEHLFEHLTYQQAQNMLHECYRVMKPGAVMRIATPNLRFLLDLYENPDKPLHKAYMENSVKNLGMPPTPAYVISRFHTSWGHQIIYDKETLTKALSDAGFKDITQCEMSKSQHAALNGIEAHFKLFPYEFIQLETMIFEARK